eukprot:2866834-Amphidinium_carterae.1
MNLCSKYHGVASATKPRLQQHIKYYPNKTLLRKLNWDVCLQQHNICSKLRKRSRDVERQVP